MMCTRFPPCPGADETNAREAHVGTSHPEQGRSLLCNGMILFDDGGAILPGGDIVEPQRRLTGHAA